MTVQTQLLIPQQFVGGGKLVQNVVPVVLAVFCQAGGVEGHPHVQAVQPDLIRIDVLVPEVPGDGAGVVRQNAVGALHALCPPCLPGNIPQDPHGLAKTHLVDVVFSGHPVCHPAGVVHQEGSVPAHRLPPTFAAGGAVQVLRPHHAKVVFIIPELFAEEPGKDPVQILFKILQPHAFYLLFYSPAKSATRSRISTASFRLTGRSGSKRPSASSCMNPKYSARAALVP